MSLQFKKYKRRFKFALQPLFAKVLSRRHKMPFPEWKIYFTETIENVVEDPEQFLGHDLPSNGLIKDIMEEIAKEFIKDLAIRTGSSDSK